jgi:hypothetical protein
LLSSTLRGIDGPRFELQQRVSFRLSLATSKLYYHED